MWEDRWHKIQSMIVFLWMCCNHSKVIAHRLLTLWFWKQIWTCNSFGIWILAQYWPGRLSDFLWHPHFLTRSPSLPPPNLSLSVPPLLLLKHWSSCFCLLLRYLAHTTYFLIFSSFISEHSINNYFSPIQ